MYICLLCPRLLRPRPGSAEASLLLTSRGRRRGFVRSTKRYNRVPFQFPIRRFLRIIQIYV